MSVALSIVFTGLCALVTDGDRAPAEVLLVDAQGVGKVNGVLLPEHAPTLVLGLSSLANAETSYPTRVVLGSPDGGNSAGQIGIWDLAGSEVRIRVQGAQPAGIQLFRPAEGSSSWPETPRNVNDPAAWRDLRFVADMKALAGDGSVDPALIGIGGAESALPRALAARIHLDGGRVEAGMPAQEADRDTVFEFRDAATMPRLRQAVTDTIRWSLESERAIVIDITPVTGGPTKHLVLAPSTATHTLFISNLPAVNVHPGALDGPTGDEMAALHFGAYYELLRVKPDERPLPRLAIAAFSQRATGMMGHPFCPPAWFHKD